jgi:hypothetical protein
MNLKIIGSTFVGINNALDPQFITEIFEQGILVAKNAIS